MTVAPCTSSGVIHVMLISSGSSVTAMWICSGVLGPRDAKQLPSQHKRRKIGKCIQRCEQKPRIVAVEVFCCLSGIPTEVVQLVLRSLERIQFGATDPNKQFYSVESFVPQGLGTKK